MARLVQTYLDGELDLERAEAVASHLERCDRCGPDAELLEAVRHALAGLAVLVDRDAACRSADHREARDPQRTTGRPPSTTPVD